jgi:hypothetical protein
MGLFKRKQKQLREAVGDRDLPVRPRRNSLIVPDSYLDGLLAFYPRLMGAVHLIIVVLLCATFLVSLALAVLRLTWSLS